MPAQPADDKAKPVGAKPKPVYSQKTLRRIKHARVTRDLILCIGSVVFALLSFVIPVPSYTVNDPIRIFALVLALIFGVAALMRGIMEPNWDRDWSLSLRYGFSIFFVVFGAYFVVFALDQSGYIGVQGWGTTTNCTYESDSGLGRSGGGSHSYACDIDVHWSDGTITHERLDSTTPVNSGQDIKYARAAKTGLLSIFPIDDQPVAAWTEVWFYLLTGLAIFLQSVFALCILVFARRPKLA